MTSLQESQTIVPSICTCHYQNNAVIRTTRFKITVLYLGYSADDNVQCIRYSIKVALLLARQSSRSSNLPFFFVSIILVRVLVFYSFSLGEPHRLSYISSFNRNDEKHKTRVLTHVWLPSFKEAMDGRRPESS